ncbi:potassium:proton antiporter [Novosphingobium sp. FGD1]|jgi:prepilin peptidase CpaA|uniref:Potassium:proton antiporter n=1 Tax=Novosphingobium silvae TaxID=2692619 RepID=A0A7X4GF28_9SPHN|nr:prepilin peptidase [Novosphingobium silvae]MYL97428.1 potassium:proton antiporter [Novosphingobium silvae]
MSGGYFSYALLAALATALLIAAFTDLRRREINNWLNLSIALAAPLWWLAAGLGPIAIAYQLGLAAVTFALACVLFATGQMGGGDVKLLGALALWFPPASFMNLVVLMALVGGGGSIAMAALNMQRVPGEAVRDVLAGLVALVWVWCVAAIVFAVATGRPVVAEASVEALARHVPGLWALALVALVTGSILILGLRHIMRRQKSRLEVPYGIAISAAGLWVLGEQTLAGARMAAQTG